MRSFTIAVVSAAVSLSMTIALGWAMLTFVAHWIGWPFHPVLVVSALLLPVLGPFGGLCVGVFVVLYRDHV